MKGKESTNADCFVHLAYIAFYNEIVCVCIRVCHCMFVLADSADTFILRCAREKRIHTYHIVRKVGSRRDNTTQNIRVNNIYAQSHTRCVVLYAN